MQSVLILSFSGLAADPRVSRQISLLAGHYRVTSAGFGGSPHAGIEHLQLVPRHRTPIRRVLATAYLKLGSHERFYWSSPTIQEAMEVLGARHFDVTLANDLTALPLACRLKSRCGVIFDAHEYSPRELEDRFFWRFLFASYNDYLCRKYLPTASAVTTVCHSIANEYRSNYGVTPEVVYSAPAYEDLLPKKTDSTSIRLVHHGGAIPSRKLELMVDAMSYVDDRFHLDLMLVPGDTAYLARISNLAHDHPRVRVVPPVPMLDLPRHLNQYDIGVFLLPPTNFNYRYALPNKFFEFVQARLAVAIGPSPEMAQLVQQYSCGIVAKDFTPHTFADRLNALTTDELDRLKQGAHVAAKELCFETSAPVLLGIVEHVLGNA